MPNCHPHLSQEKNLRDLTREWDAVADLREEQIVSRTDLSFHLVLVPELERLARDANWSRVLDAGCGTGVLTSRLARRAKEVVGVDMSRASIEIANARHAASNITYVRSTLERYVAGLDHPTFTLAVCNMTLMTVPKLTRFVAAIARSLRPGGTFVFTVTHPWFWPAYWGYDKAPWFDYNRELAIEAPFRISLQDSPLVTTHFHRPLRQYVEALARAGLTLTKLDEPLPKRSDLARYPVEWKFPRFLAGQAVHARQTPAE